MKHLNLFRAIAFSVIAFSLFLFLGCSTSIPSDEDAQQVLEKELKTKNFNLFTFQKTNGQSLEEGGVKKYKFFYSMTCEFKPLPDAKGINFKGTGFIIFEMTENGWVATQHKDLGVVPN